MTTAICGSKMRLFRQDGHFPGFVSLSSSKTKPHARQRAGTTTTFAFGDAVSTSQANYNGSTDGSGPSQINRQKTMPIGGFPANGFGIHDMFGNISEWVEDCWADDARVGAAVFASADAKEGPRAFLEKRPAVFQGV